MIDFHSHILYGIDDGSRSKEMSLEMLNNSVKEGVKYICATPHFIYNEYETDINTYSNLLQELQDAMSGKINVLKGLEVYINPELPQLYKEGKIWTINDKNYMLIELPMREFPIYTEKVFYDLRLIGITPILAHPERNLSIMKNPQLLINLIEQGTIAQMNAGSLTGMYGEPVKKVAIDFVKKNLIHILGSDGHNNKLRQTNINQAYNKIKEINKDLYNSIEQNSNDVIRGMEIDVLPIKEKKEKTFFNFFNKFKKK